MKKIVILGSTGSVGTSALEVVRRHPNLFKIVGLAACGNARALARQANSFKVRSIALAEATKYKELKRHLKGTRNILKGEEGMVKLASLREADTVLVAISGIAAIHPLLAALRAGKRVALANKEAIVAAGAIIMQTRRSHGGEIIPVDSEHNSIFQCIKEEDKNSIKKIFLMGSGGPLKNVKKSLFDTLKPSRILSHPVWKMGKKISVDSATMMNKALEIIEARHLFGIDVSKIEVLFHPEAVIHSMVEFLDGNISANLFYPDMKMPIFYAFNYPKRRHSRLKGLDFSKIKNISFEKPDVKKFPALSLAYAAARKGGTHPACLSSANEEAVKLYLDGKIRFSGIIDNVRKALSRHRNIKNPSLEEILHVAKWAKEEVRRLAG